MWWGGGKYSAFVSLGSFRLTSACEGPMRLGVGEGLWACAERRPAFPFPPPLWYPARCAKRRRPGGGGVSAHVWGDGRGAASPPLHRRPPRLSEADATYSAMATTGRQAGERAEEEKKKAALRRRGFPRSDPAHRFGAPCPLKAEHAGLPPSLDHPRGEVGWAWRRGGKGGPGIGSPSAPSLVGAAMNE